MSHRKSHSHGSIPFSWEDKPGICKTPNNECPLNSINQKSSSKLPPSHHFNNISKKNNTLEFQDKKIYIPLPPYQTQPTPPQRSTSMKGIKLQEDPFLVAYKECTKSDQSCKMQSKNKKGVGFNFLSLRRNYCIFSCRSAIDVKDDSYIKLSRLPRLPKHRDRSRMLEDEDHRGFNYHESWL
ncbi:unnamed protein product [Trifolium pratense]|uniref:Uncharacterized protein n=1 Tax=Trifolium pratense TaxID=57577 RepID=A0ACB0ITL4_TRIPR|nr:unnamed protein product [Trifolium pratense]